MNTIIHAAYHIAHPFTHYKVSHLTKTIPLQHIQQTRVTALMITALSWLVMTLQQSLFYGALAFYAISALTKLKASTFDPGYVVPFTPPSSPNLVARASSLDPKRVDKDRLESFRRQMLRKQNLHT